MRHRRFALRLLARHRGAYGPAIGILALGIGMSVAMFSIVDAVVLRPLPFPRQDAIHVISKADALAGAQVVELAYPELGDLQQHLTQAEAVAVMPTTVYGYGRVIQIGRSAPVQIESTPVSHDFFRVLGVSPAIGRDFAASDERVGAAPVVILADWVWRTYFNADREIIGRTVRLNGQEHLVIGVMGSSVEFSRGSPASGARRLVRGRGAAASVRRDDRLGRPVSVRIRGEPIVSEMLYGVSARNPLILGTVITGLFVASVVAAWWPASIAAGRDPKIALRNT